MASDDYLLASYMTMQKALLSSLRLKDVLDQCVLQFSELAAGAKVAIFLADNESLALKLMAAKGYTAATIEQCKVLPFHAESLLKFVVQKRTPAVARSQQETPAISQAVMQREGSAGQIALPLISANLLVGGVLIDVRAKDVLDRVDFLNQVADIAALALANSILFGRSEYERERLSTFYKTSCALANASLQIGDALQICADTAVLLANTPNCAVLLYDPKAHAFQLAAYKGLEGSSLRDFDLGKDSLASSCLSSGVAEYIGEAKSVPAGMPRASGGALFQSVIAIPLIYQKKPLGVIEVFSAEARAFHREQIDLLTSLGSQVSTALNLAMSQEDAISKSIIDAHTGLYNQIYFDEALSREIDRCKRHNHDLSLLMIDIDHLSQINNHLGEERGDAAIRYVAQILRLALREIDILCRTGGEEFAVILPETSGRSAVEVAERLRQRIRSEAAPGIGLVTHSTGVASYPNNADSAEALRQAASQALDIAKYEGRDRVKEAQTGRVAAQGPIAWDELARQAKLAVISERQANMQSRLTVAPEYAAWLTKTPPLVKKRSSENP